MEEWRDIQGYEGLYQVSNYGSVKSIDRILPNGKNRKGKVLYVHLINGYPTVSLCKNNKQHNHKIHRLVAQSFIPNPDNKPCVDHIDANRANNNVINLRWVTYQENNNSPLSYKARSTAINAARSVMVAQYNKEGALLAIYPSIIIASKFTSAKANCICDCCSGRIKTAGGFIWKYVNEI